MLSSLTHVHIKIIQVLHSFHFIQSLYTITVDIFLLFDLTSIGVLAIKTYIVANRLH